jgi:ABC-2 type transport system permease protein
VILVPEVRGLLTNRQVLATLVRRDLRVRYARSWLGYLWSVLDPLAMSLIYFIVFTWIFRARHVGNEPYFLHLLIGLLAWQWFSLCMTETSRALLQESRLVKSTNLPRELWVVRVVVAKGVEFVFSLPVLAVFTLYYVLHGDAHLNWTLVFFPFAMALTFLLATGVGLILAPITVLVTDMARVVRIALRMGFYATPIIYSIHSAPESLRKFLVFNPVSGIMELFRTGFFDTVMNQRAVVIAVVACAVVLLLGVVVFKRFEPAVLKEI